MRSTILRTATARLRSAKPYPHTAHFRQFVLTLLMALLTATAWADDDFVDNGDGSYIIHNVDDWSQFASSVNDGTTYSGQTVTLAADITRLSLLTQHGAAMAITAAAADASKGTLTITATPSGFDGSKTQSLSLIYSEDKRSYQTAYTTVFVITHPTAGSMAITLPTTSSGKYAVGDNYQLSAVFTPAYITETDVTWSVDDTTLATIDANGVLTPIKNGTVKITCTSKDNPAVTASVTIEITGGNIPLNEGGVSQGGAE